MTFPRWIDLLPRGDERGSLIAIESGQTIPFEIRRVYYIFGTLAGARRGLHAHRTLQQIAICIMGSCTVLLDDGRRRVEFPLNKSDRGLFIDRMTWREMYDFSPDCVVLVLASEHYDEFDYIRSLDQFYGLAK